MKGGTSSDCFKFLLKVSEGNCGGLCRSFHHDWSPNVMDSENTGSSEGLLRETNGEHKPENKRPASSEVTPTTVFVAMFGG